MENLIYTCAAYSPEYAQILRPFLTSLAKFNPAPGRNFDMMVFCDESTFDTVSEICLAGAISGVKLAKFPSATTPQAASAFKLAIFSVLKMSNPYKKCIYIDLDSLVLTDIGAVFRQPFAAGILYVWPESKKNEDHLHPYWSPRNPDGGARYSSATLDAFRREGVYPFNAGIFAFKSCAEMESLFAECLLDVFENAPHHFYEQSAMNFLFNSKRKISYDLFNDLNYASDDELSQCSGQYFVPNKIIHFKGSPGSTESKLERILKTSASFFGTQIIFETREKMLASLVKKGAKIGEIGVFKGDFSSFLLTLSPLELWLIDPFGGNELVSGDSDGNHVKTFSSEELMDYVKDRFEGDKRVSLVRDRSSAALQLFPDSYFDCIYIDGDHSYEGTLSDLRDAFRKVRSGGIIAGHDLHMNSSKTSAIYDFGVNRAVEDFCTETGLSIDCKAMDGCVSFAITLLK